MGLIMKGPPPQGYHHFPYDLRFTKLRKVSNVFFREIKKMPGILYFNLKKSFFEWQLSVVLVSFYMISGILQFAWKPGG